MLPAARAPVLIWTSSRAERSSETFVALLVATVLPQQFGLTMRGGVSPSFGLGSVILSGSPRSVGEFMPGIHDFGTLVIQSFSTTQFVRNLSIQRACVVLGEPI
jgi:hypothetical protein